MTGQLTTVTRVRRDTGFFRGVRCLRWPFFLLILALPSVALALSREESLLLDRARAIATAPVEDFTVLGGTGGARDGGYRYQLAFLGYGLCSVVEGEPSQSLFRMQPLDVIAEGPFRPRGNVVPVPEGPGLGVTLARDKLAHCHRLYCEHGAYDKFHDPERPGVLRRLPLR